MKTICFSETLESLQTTRRYNPEARTRHYHCRENVKSKFEEPFASPAVGVLSFASAQGGALMISLALGEAS
jgi:hypothetical protein